jgi:hypothetical protein
VSFTHRVDAAEPDGVALMLALRAASERCRELGPPYAAVLGGWAEDLAAGGTTLRVAGLDRLGRETLHAVVRMAFERDTSLAPLGALLRAVERWAYGPGGYRQLVPAGPPAGRML